MKPDRENPKPLPGPKEPIRVFIVDDHPLFSEVLSDVLNRTGDFIVVGEARDGESALKRLEGLAVDIVILDLIMPGMGGLEVLETLRAKRFGGRMVMCSGLGSEKAIMEAFALGVSAFVEKTMVMEELFSTLRAVAEGKFPLNSRMSGLLRDFVRRRKVFKPIATGDMVILRGLATGRALKEIADELGISTSGAYKARARIKARMSIQGAAGFVHLATSLGLFSPSAASLAPEAPVSGRRRRESATSS